MQIQCPAAALHKPLLGLPIAAQGAALDRMPSVIVNPRMTVSAARTAAVVQVPLLPGHEAMQRLAPGCFCGHATYNNAPQSALISSPREFIDRCRAWSDMRL